MKYPVEALSRPRPVLIDISSAFRQCPETLRKVFGQCWWRIFKHSIRTLTSSLSCSRWRILSTGFYMILFKTASESYLSLHDQYFNRGQPDDATS